MSNKRTKRVAVFRSNGQLLAEFSSVSEAARVLAVPSLAIERVLGGQLSVAASQRKRIRTNFGLLSFREIDTRKKGAC